MQVQHRLMIRHPRQTAILVVDNKGEARLPTFTSDDRHTAEVDYINAAVLERCGLLTTALRSLHHSEPCSDVVPRVHDLETHGDSTLRSHSLQWCGSTELLSLPDGEDRVAIAVWLEGETAPGAVVDGHE